MDLSKTPLSLPDMIVFLRNAKVLLDSSGASDVSIDMTPQQFSLILDELEKADLFNDLIDSMDAISPLPRS